MYDRHDLFKLTDWRDDQYFNQRLDHYFLYDNGFGLKVAKVKPPTDKEAYYWFVSPAFHLKATTTRCVSLLDVAGTLVTHKDSDQVRGKLGEFGVVDTPYVYVYWTHYAKDMKVGMPVALPSYRELKLVTPPLMDLN